MNTAFSELILADKLSKLNNTQQCIETLSHWCIYHRKDAEQVVETWDKQFHSLEKERKIPFLYLANDILQNSKRNGKEFVEEFWKVLPGALKDVTENGDDHGKNVVSRLVGIWEERRVFGSRAKGLKDLMLGNEPIPKLDLNKKRSRSSSSIKIIRRDSRSVRIKLHVGGMAEKIISAFNPVINEQQDEEEDLQKCKTAVRKIGKMEKDVENACSSQVGDTRREMLGKELREEETALKQYIQRLKLVEANRAALVSQLKETLNEQESELEKVRTQLQVAEAMVHEAGNMRRRLDNEPAINPTKPDSNEQVTANTSKKSAAATAAEVADRLAASSHSQQIITSVLSSLAAEEAKNNNNSTSQTNKNNNNNNINKNATKVDKPQAVVQPMVVSTPHQPPPQAMLVSPATPLQPQPNMYPVPAQQFLQPSGAVATISLPYSYCSAGPLPPQPPPPPPPPPLLAPPMAFIPPAPPAAACQQQLPPMNQLAQPMQFALQQPMVGPASFRPIHPPHGMPFYPLQPH